MFSAALAICSCGGGGDKPSSGPYTPPANVAVSSVSVSPSSSELVIGGTVQLSATVSPSNATDKSVTWSSSNQTVATVTPTGLVTAKAEGSANITANASGKTAVCKVTVKKPTVAVTSVVLDQQYLYLNKGTSETLKATVKPDNATDKTVTWASSKTDIATVDNTGKVTAVAKGEATITASCGGKTGRCNVTVIIPVESISLNKTTLTLTEGESQTLIATVKPDDASNKTVGWVSSNTSVATVDGNGKVTAVSEGFTFVIAAGGGDKTAFCEVTVKKKIIAVTDIILDQTSLNLEKGTSATLTATIKPDDATDKNVTWSSGNSSIATVNSNGVVTAIGGGYTTITATAGDKTAVCNVTVTVPVTGITLDQPSMNLVKGETKTLTATVTPNDATDKTVTWTSNNSSIASVDNYGIVTGREIGNTAIVATCSGKTAYCNVTVTVPVSSITLNKTELSLKEGTSETLTATVNPNDATDKTVTWTSSSPTVATVDNTGKVTANTPGSAQITATSGGKSAVCTVTVTKKGGLSDRPDEEI